MSNKNLNKWFNDGAIAGFDNKQSLADSIKDNKVPVDAVEAYTRGYLRGRISSPLADFKSWLKYMDNDQLTRLGDELHKLQSQLDEELRREEAAYKIKGLFDQYD